MSAEKKGAACIWLDLPKDSRGRFYSRKDGAYRCAAPDPRLPTHLPASITKHRNFKWPPERVFVTTADCSKCPTHTTVDGQRAIEKLRAGIAALKLSRMPE